MSPSRKTPVATSAVVPKPAPPRVWDGTRLGDEATWVKGVGPERAKVLATLGINTVGDLLEFYPRRYLDRSRILAIRDLQETESEITVVGTVSYLTPKRNRRGRQWLTAGHL